ncbi:hypothetical protein BC829DRAFT_469056 [Chytridium lagenaria]|nr:hypothetical protein BC829DRAFT_469056 [Chytridium lagenaria]
MPETYRLTILTQCRWYFYGLRRVHPKVLFIPPSLLDTVFDYNTIGVPNLDTICEYDEMVKFGQDTRASTPFFLPSKDDKKKDVLLFGKERHPKVLFIPPSLLDTVFDYNTIGVPNLDTICEYDEMVKFGQDTRASTPLFLLPSKDDKKEGRPTRW